MPVEQEKRLNLLLFGIGCFFFLFKIISTYFAVHAKVFLLHVANGGLMQVLWLRRDLWKENAEGNEENFCADQGT